MTDRTPEYEREAREWMKSQPWCCGYPKCDGDLEGGTHSDACPLFGQEERTTVQLLADFAAQRDQEHARGLAEARFAPLGDNHHNALACPYCNPGHKLESASALLDGLLQKAKQVLANRGDVSESEWAALRAVIEEVEKGRTP